MVGDEVGREVSAIKLHTLNHVQRGFGAFGFFNGDNAVFANALHGIGDQFADRAVVVGRNRADLSDFLTRLDIFAHLANFVDDFGHGLIDAALEIHWIGAGGDVFEAFAEDNLSQHGRRRGAVTGDVGRLGRDFLNHLSAHVLVGVLEFDFFSDGNTVFGDGRRAKAFVQDDVATLRSQRHLDSIC